MNIIKFINRFYIKIIINNFQFLKIENYSILNYYFLRYSEERMKHKDIY